jgi:hypothetical protein
MPPRSASASTSSRDTKVIVFDIIYHHSYIAAMCIIGHSAGYRPDYANLARNYCRLGVQAQLAEQAAHRAAAFETAREAFGAKRARADSVQL